MKPLRHTEPLVPHQRDSEPSFQWDSAIVRDLITENTDTGSRPAFLVLGKRETRMLRRHLGAAFGPASVQCLKNTYYMGLQVIEDPAESLLCVAGRKATFQPRKARPNFLDSLTGTSRWRFSA